MDEVKVVKLIKTTILRRGDGKDTPVRIIEQYWTFDGELVFQIDPCAEIITPEQKHTQIKP